MPGGWEWLILVGVVLLLFGAKRLPEMARSVGQSARVFRGEMRGMKSDDDTRKNADPAAGQQAPAPAAPQSALPPVQAQQVKQDATVDAPKIAQPGTTPGTAAQ